MSTPARPARVNLVNTAGLTFNYWDGAAGPKNDGVINGGDGVWQSSAGNLNWTESTGSFNAPFNDGAFAIFEGTPGTVSVDNSLGAVLVSGMQFMVDGYRIKGDPITLTGTSATIRVGDGTSAGAAYQATVDAVLQGSSQLIKDDQGTLVLTGTNTYSGGTRVAQGTLEVASDANLGDASGVLGFGNGTLHTTASFTSARSVTLDSSGIFDTDPGTTLTLTGQIWGGGSLVKTGGGTLVQTGPASYTGSTTIDGGTLRAGAANILNAASAFSVATGGTLDLAGFDQTIASVANAGDVRLNGGPGTTLTISGNYVGNAGTVHINAALGSDSSVTDRMIVHGDTSGTGVLAVSDVGGTGAPTVEGIKIVAVDGTSNAAFTLQGDYVFQGQQAVVGGAYAYQLYKGGVSTPGDGDWYLRSALINPVSPPGPLYQPGVPLYEAYANVLQSFNKLPTLQERVGNRSWTGGERGVVTEGAPDGLIEGDGLWGRIEGTRNIFDAWSSTTGTSHIDSTWRLEAGADGVVVQNSAGQLVAGLSVEYGLLSSQVSSLYGSGSIDSMAGGLGATLTWYGSQGFYLDAQARVTWYGSDLSSSTAQLGLVGDNPGVGYGLSLEAGQKIPLTSNLSITPQVQLAYSAVNFDKFKDVFGADVSLDGGATVTGRVGLSVDYEQASEPGTSEATRTHLYGIANLYYDFAGGSQTTVSGTTFANQNDPLSVGIGLGGSYNWNNDNYSVYGEASAVSGLSSIGKSYSLRATGGMRAKW